MENNFKEVIEKIKTQSINPEETKRYILAIKRVLRKNYEICKEEQEEAEILQDYLQEYNNDLKFDGDVQKIYSRMLILTLFP